MLTLKALQTLESAHDQQARAMTSNWVLVGYLAAAILFILGLKRLSRPRTAVRGNQFGASGMLVAVVVALVDHGTVGLEWIVGGMVLGALIGVLAATRVQMTAMPELVALFNGFGGGASVLVAAASHIKAADLEAHTGQASGAASMATLIGAVTLHRQSGRFRQTERLVPLAGIPRTASGEYRSAADRCGLSGAHDRQCSHPCVAVAADSGGGPARPDCGGAHRRCRHAGGDSAAQLAVGRCSSGRRFRARQQPPHHRGAPW